MAMKKWLLLMGLLLLAALPRMAGATDVCGNITTDTTWTTSGSPYNLTCAVRVNSGVTLTIDSGVSVAGDYQLSVFGTLNASDATITGASSIYFASGSSGNITACTINKYIPIYSPFVTISNNTISSMVYINALASLHDNDFTGSGYISAYLVNGLPLDGNDFNGTMTEGYYIANSSVIITNSTISRSSGTAWGAIYLENSTATLDNVSISGFNFPISFNGINNSNPLSLSNVNFSGCTYPNKLGINGTISVDFALKNYIGTIYVSSGDVTVNSGVTLIMPSGYTWEGGRYLIVNGALNATGAAISGDYHIQFNNGSSGSMIGCTLAKDIIIKSSSVIIAQNNISNIISINKLATVSDNNFSGNGYISVSSVSGLILDGNDFNGTMTEGYYIANSSVIITNSTISRSSGTAVGAIYLENSTATLDNVSISGFNFPISFNGINNSNPLSLSNVNFSGCTYPNKLGINGTISVDFALKNYIGTIYVSSGDVTVNSGVTLIMPSGYTWEGGRYLIVNGALNATGAAISGDYHIQFNNGSSGNITGCTLGKKIIINSPSVIIAQNNISNIISINKLATVSDNNFNGSGYISIYSISVLTLDGNDFNGTMSYGYYVTDSSVTITNSTIIRSSGTGTYGIYAYGSSNVKATDCAITGFQHGLYVKDTAQATIHYSDIYGNTTFGVNNTNTATIVDARYNYWGSDTGPGPVGPGSGDKVSTYVDYDNWSPQPYRIFNFSITGTITDSVSHLPINNALVKVLTREDYTDQNGLYHILSLPSGTYTINASAPYYNTRNKTGVVVVAGQITSGQNLTMVPKPIKGVLSGQVSEVGTGSALDGVRVVLTNNEGGYTRAVTFTSAYSTLYGTTTSGGGLYYFPDVIAAGTYSIVASKPGYFPTIIGDVPVVAGGSTVRNIPLEHRIGAIPADLAISSLEVEPVSGSDLVAHEPARVRVRIENVGGSAWISRPIGLTVQVEDHEGVGNWDSPWSDREKGKVVLIQTKKVALGLPLALQLLAGSDGITLQPGEWKEYLIPIDFINADLTDAVYVRLEPTAHGSWAHYDPWLDQGLEYVARFNIFAQPVDSNEYGNDKRIFITVDFNPEAYLNCAGTLLAMVGCSGVNKLGPGALKTIIKGEEIAHDGLEVTAELRALVEYAPIYLKNQEWWEFGKLLVKTKLAVERKMAVYALEIGGEKVAAEVVGSVFGFFESAWNELSLQGCGAVIGHVGMKAMKEGILKALASEAGIPLYSVNGYCPVDITVTNLETGTYAQVTNSGSKFTNLDTSTVSKVDDIKMIDFWGIGSYRIDLQGRGVGNADILAMQPRENGRLAAIKWEDIPITASTKAWVVLSEGSTAYDMAMDPDGDGVVESLFGPTSVIVSPKPPADLQILEYGDSYATVQWASSVDPTITGYRFYLGRDDGVMEVNYTLPAGQKIFTAYNIENLRSIYFFRVAAIGQEGIESTLSQMIYTDQDNDGMSDPWEVKYGLNPNEDDALGDPDTDAVTNLEEWLNHCRPDRTDTDRDGLEDGDELSLYETSCENPDSDFGGENDGQEVLASKNPLWMNDDIDNIAPFAVNDLEIIDKTSTSVTLQWTAVGDDGDCGQATSYDLRYSRDVINEGNFNQAQQVAHPPYPASAGNIETFVVDDLTAGMDYYFAMKVADEVPNVSGISNIVPSPNEVLEGDMLLEYMARLENYNNILITGDTVELTFGIYEKAYGGYPLCSERQSVYIASGIYHVFLGGISHLNPAIFSKPSLYMGIKLNDGTELYPRDPITSNPYAFNSSRWNGQRIQSGTATIFAEAASSITVQVIFPASFKKPPKIQIGAPQGLISGEWLIVSAIEEITIHGFKVKFRTVSGNPATGSAEFDWIGIGE